MRRQRHRSPPRNHEGRRPNVALQLTKHSWARMFPPGRCVTRASCVLAGERPLRSWTWALDSSRVSSVKTIAIRPATSDEDVAAVRELVREYASAPAWEASFATYL